MFTTIIACITITSLTLIIYHLIIYPLLLRWMAKARTGQQITIAPRGYVPNVEDQHLPSMTIVIPAHNEAAYICEKIRNLAIQDYPAEKFKTIIICDGCTDNTAELALECSKERECQHLSIEVIQFPKNRGKVAVLNEAIVKSTTDIVAFSDVSALISADAFHIAARHFTAPDTGVLCSCYHLLKPGSKGEALYWQYQNNIKNCESLVGSVLGTHGALYFIRRELYQPLPWDTINDDFILPMQIVAKGYRATYASNIAALELENASQNLDYQRRKRIAAGNMQQLIRLRNLLKPRYKGVAFMFLSGKVLRTLLPFLMLFLLLGSIYLSFSYLFFTALSVLQISIYGFAIWYHFYGQKITIKPIQSIYYLVSGTIASFIGSMRYILLLDHGSWKKIDPSNKKADDLP